MTSKPKKRTRLPNDPERLTFHAWSSANRGFYEDFRVWLKACGYGPSALNLYSVGARYALGYLQKPYWQIQPEQDLAQVEAYLLRCPLTASTRASYRKGLACLGDFLRLKLRAPTPERPLNWDYHLDGLPEWIGPTVRAFLTHRRRSWLPEQQYHASTALLSHLCGPLRWIAAHFPLSGPESLTPATWNAYLDARLERGVSPVTLNGNLFEMQQWIRFLEGEGQPVCERFLLVKKLNETSHLPKDLPAEQLRKLIVEIEQVAASPNNSQRRMGRMDRAWFLLMLHCGLRTGEVRRLKQADIDYKRRQLRIEQSKGLKDRIVFLSPAVVQAMQTYAAVRGPADALPPYFFVFRHTALSPWYCYERLHYFGQRCGVTITPHQLRHCCATLLLNAGAPMVSVQAILGHKNINTTLGYARLYDGTLAADYYRAMNEVERQLQLVENQPQTAPSLGELVALVDSLRSGTLNESQANAMQAIRAGLLALAREEPKYVVKVLLG